MMVHESERYFGVAVLVASTGKKELRHWACLHADKAGAPEKVEALHCAVCGKRIKCFRELGDGHIEPAD